MIVLWGLEHDSPLALVHQCLHERAARHLFVDQADTFQFGLRITYADMVSGVLSAYGSEYALEGIRAWYLRPYDLRDLPDTPRSGADLERAMSFESALWTYADLCEGLVLNRPSSMLSNTSKPLQSEVIRQAGFCVPETLITTDTEALAEFERARGALIYKSISGQRSVVDRFDAADTERLRDLRWCPSQFQEYVEGEEYRVHVVGDRIFATRVISSLTDYRYGPAEYRPAAIPKEVEDMCRRLTSALRLQLSGLDLKRSPRGDWYCFEANPSPAYSCYESDDQRISAAVADLLMR